jgi:hypothetical protein
MFARKQSVKDVESLGRSIEDHVYGKLNDVKERLHRLENPAICSTDSRVWTLQKAEDLAETKELLHLLIKELGYEVKGPEAKGRSLVKVKK